MNNGASVLLAGNIYCFFVFFNHQKDDIVHHTLHCLYKITKDQVFLSVK